MTIRRGLGLLLCAGAAISAAPPAASAQRPANPTPPASPGQTMYFGTCTPSFGSATFIGAGLALAWIRSGDFNGDGRPDLAIANGGSDFISVALALPDGAFATAVSVPVGGFSSSLTVADFNGDGRPDLAVSTTAAIVVMLGNGDGTFQSHGPLPGGAGGATTAGDANGDGDLDLFATWSGNTIAVFLGDGSGNFAAPSTYPVGDSPVGVEAADFDGDGNLDLAVTNQQDSTVSILLGSGTGTFSSGTVVPVGLHPWNLAAGDLDGDGNVDLAVADVTYGIVSIRLGDGAGGFTAAPDTGNGATAVGIADFTGDGVPDLATTGNGSPQILIGDGTGSFTPGGSAWAGVGSFSLAVADFNGDGDLDLSLVNFYTNNAAVLFGDGSGALGPQTSFPASSLRPIDAVFADFDGDAKVDAAVYDNNTNEVSVLAGDGAGGFGPPAPFPTLAAFGQGLTSGDFDGNGVLDVAVSGGNNQNVSILLGLGGGVLGPPAGYATPAFFPQSLTTGDFNEDGDLDLAVAGNGATIFLGDGAGGLEPPRVLPGDYYAYGIGAADLNRDGHLDLVVTNPQASVYLGDGAGGFSGPANFGVGLAPLDVAFGDFNEDGNLDVAVSLFDSQGYGASIIFGDGAGGFSAPTRLTFTSTGFSIAAADFDRDRHLDVAVGSFAGVSLMTGDGQGHFQGPLTLPLGYAGVAAVDLNHDGRVDLVSVNPDGLTVTALLSAAIDLRPTVVPDGTVGQPYAGAMFTGFGATPPYTYESAGDLPPGLTFDAAAGVLSGTPTEGGSFTFYVAVQEHNACRYALEYVVTIAPAATRLALAVSPNPAPAYSPILLEATVTAEPPGSVAPEGVVVFTIDGAAQPGVPTSGGVATLVVTLGPGKHTISATFQGTASFGESTASPVVAVVTGGGGPTASIPTLSPGLLALLAVGLAAVGAFAAARRGP